MNRKDSIFFINQSKEVMLWVTEYLKDLEWKYMNYFTKFNRGDNRKKKKFLSNRR